jgi:hypothetical protein
MSTQKKAGYLVLAVPVTSLSAVRAYIQTLAVAVELAGLTVAGADKYGDETALAGVINIFHAASGLG